MELVDEGAVDADGHLLGDAVDAVFAVERLDLGHNGPKKVGIDDGGGGAGLQLREKVAKACCDQMWMAGAPLIVVGCGLVDEAYKTMGGRYNTVDIDVTIALDHLSLAAVAEGLGTCWIGAFEEEAVKELLGVPDGVKVVALMPVGYPKLARLIRPVKESQRKGADEIFTTDSY